MNTRVTLEIIKHAEDYVSRLGILSSPQVILIYIKVWEPLLIEHTVLNEEGLWKDNLEKPISIFKSSIPIVGVGNYNLLQYSCLENSIDRGICLYPGGRV